MNQITLGIAILLGVGLLFAKLAQLIRLPSVTGYIIAGLVLGPSCFSILTAETVGHRLDHFTQIALMLIAFGIGEHIELRRLRAVARDVTWIAVVQAVATFVCVLAGTLVTARLLGATALFRDDLVLALLLAAVAVATAPAAILHLVRELNARGPLTATLMAVVAVDDGLAIMIFGMAVAAAHQLVGGVSASPWTAILGSLSEIAFSLVIGLVTGMIIDRVLHRLHRRGEMLTGGLALLLICGEITRMLHLSPLLAGMMAGFIVINRAERDVRLFRTINRFEPPIYVLFFTLAGVHLDLNALRVAGWIGMVYFLTRIGGKYLGSWLGALLSGANRHVRDWIGLGNQGQAGVAIGLVFVIGADDRLSPWSPVITPIVLAGVVLSELIGPLLVRLTLDKGGETGLDPGESRCDGLSGAACARWLKSGDGVSLPPWEGDILTPPTRPDGVVVFGISHAATSRGLARIATIMAHHYHVLPQAVRVFAKADRGRLDREELDQLFLPERDEVNQLGYPLKQEVVFDEVASGLVAAAEYNQARAVVLGYPLGNRPLAFQKVLDRVAANVLCPVLAVRFVGAFTCRRVLVPFLFPGELERLIPVCEALAAVLHPRITFLQILHGDCLREEIESSREWLDDWRRAHLVETETASRVEPSESRLETILAAAVHHDLVIINATRQGRLQQAFFGSLAGSVVRHCTIPVIVVHWPGDPHDR